jgi:putative addiction module component (TIGR02574 family)
MNTRVKALVDEARKLTAEERADLLARLTNAFAIKDDDDGADGTPEEIEAAWLEEVERRIERADRGETTAIPHEDVMAKLRARIQQG